MRTLLAVALVGLLGLNVPVGAQNTNQNQDRNRDQNQNAGNAQMIHGVVVGVTVAGETILNYETEQAAVARATYLTVLGAPGRHWGRHEAGGDRNRESNADNRGSARDSRRDENARGENSSDQGRRHMDHVYFIAVTPQTRIFMEGEDKGNKPGSTPEDQARWNAAFEKLELGGRIVAEITPLGPPGGRPANMKHGRERTFRGQASWVEILKHESRGNEQANESSRDRSSSDKNSSESNRSDKDKNNK